MRAAGSRSCCVVTRRKRSGGKKESHQPSCAAYCPAAMTACDRSKVWPARARSQGLKVSVRFAPSKPSQAGRKTWL